MEYMLRANKASRDPGDYLRASGCVCRVHNRKLCVKCGTVEGKGVPSRGKTALSGLAAKNSQESWSGVGKGHAHRILQSEDRQLTADFWKATVKSF